MIIVIGCKPITKYASLSYQPPLSLEDEIIVLGVEHQVPDKANNIGTLSFKDWGFSRNCRFDKLISKSKSIARLNGANIIKLVEIDPPVGFSECYNLKILLYSYSDNLKEIRQYHL